MTATARILSLKRTLASVKRRTLEVRLFTRPGQTLAARTAWQHIQNIREEIARLESLNA